MLSVARIEVEIRDIYCTSTREMGISQRIFRAGELRSRTRKYDGNGGGNERYMAEGVRMPSVRAFHSEEFQLT